MDSVSSVRWLIARATPTSSRNRGMKRVAVN